MRESPYPLFNGDIWDRVATCLGLFFQTVAGLVPVTRYVASHGPLHHILHPRLLMSTPLKPSVLRCLQYCRVNQRSAIMSRPPGRRTRTASSIALNLPGRPLMLCIATLETTRSKLSAANGKQVMSAV